MSRTDNKKKNRIDRSASHFLPALTDYFMDRSKTKRRLIRQERGSGADPLHQYVLLITLKPRRCLSFLSGGELDGGGGGGGRKGRRGRRGAAAAAWETLRSDIVRTPRRRRADGESHIIRVIIGRK